VLLTTDRAIRRLNRRFRGKDKPTDVLSFPATDFVQDQKKNQERGDLAISVETARKQAAEQGHALTCELQVLMLHGLLHLAGYDHESDDGRMARREHQLRARLGLPLGLIERAVRSPGKATADPSTPLRVAQDDKPRGKRTESGGDRKTPTRSGRP